MAHAAPVMLAQKSCYMTSRGGFATKHVWVTRYAPDEHYASGEFPNQHAGGDGLPKYTSSIAGGPGTNSPAMPTASRSDPAVF
jgi:primary-amine oxidase